MAIDPGQYTVQDLLNKAGVKPEEAAAVDYNDDGWDRRRIRVGGLPFDHLDSTIEVPESATELEVTVDGDVVGSLKVNAREVPEAATNFKAASSNK